MADKDQETEVLRLYAFFPSLLVSISHAPSQYLDGNIQVRVNIPTTVLQRIFDNSIIQRALHVT